MRFGDSYIENVSHFESEALEELPEFPVPVSKLAELIIVAEPGVEVEVEDWAVLLIVGAKTDVSDSAGSTSIHASSNCQQLNKRNMTACILLEPL
jgi:hypothetical protein